MLISFFIDGENKISSVLKKEDRSYIEEYINYSNFVKVSNKDYSKYVIYFDNNYYKLNSKEDFVLLSVNYSDYKFIKTERKNRDFIALLMILTQFLVVPNSLTFFISILIFIFSIWFKLNISIKNGHFCDHLFFNPVPLMHLPYLLFEVFCGIPSWLIMLLLWLSLLIGSMISLPVLDLA